MVTQQANMQPAALAFQMGAFSSPGYSTSDTAPCLRPSRAEKMGFLHHMGDMQDAPGSWFFLPFGKKFFLFPFLLLFV